MIGIISQVCGLDHLPSLHELSLGKDSNDLTDALACAISYRVYHSLKFGKMLEIKKAIETGMFGHVRAYAFSSAKALLHDYDIKSNGPIPNCGKTDLHWDSSQLGFLANSPDQAISTSHLHGISSHDPLT